MYSSMKVIKYFLFVNDISSGPTISECIISNIFEALGVGLL